MFQKVVSRSFPNSISDLFPFLWDALPEVEPQSFQPRPQPFPGPSAPWKKERHGRVLGSHVLRGRKCSGPPLSPASPGPLGPAPTSLHIPEPAPPFSPPPQIQRGAGGHPRERFSHNPLLFALSRFWRGRGWRGPPPHPEAPCPCRTAASCTRNWNEGREALNSARGGAAVTGETPAARFPGAALPTTLPRALKPLQSRPARRLSFHPNGLPAPSGASPLSWTAWPQPGQWH